MSRVSYKCSGGCHQSLLPKIKFAHPLQDEYIRQWLLLKLISLCLCSLNLYPAALQLYSLQGTVPEPHKISTTNPSTTSLQSPLLSLYNLLYSLSTEPDLSQQPSLIDGYICIGYTMAAWSNGCIDRERDSCNKHFSLVKLCGCAEAMVISREFNVKGTSKLYFFAARLHTSLQLPLWLAFSPAILYTQHSRMQETLTTLFGLAGIPLILLDSQSYYQEYARAYFSSRAQPMRKQSD